MHKTELQNTWGHYLDTNKLVDDVMDLLTRYNHGNSEHGVCKMLDVFFTNNKGMIEMFQTSKNYIGDLRIAFDIELERTENKSDVYYFCRAFLANLDARETFVTMTDDEGRTFADCRRTSVRQLTARDLLHDDMRAILQINNRASYKFNRLGEYKPSITRYNEFETVIGTYMAENYQSQLQDHTRQRISEMPSAKDINLTGGMKTSRAFNRICKAYGADKIHPAKEVNNEGVERTVYPYDKLFAQYSDLVSGLKRKLKFFMSLNPLDYLAMSFGTNWSSCHTIDRENIREMPNSYSGQYCGGTLSYMLDSTSFITFVHDKIPTNFTEEGKIYRNMFHFEDNQLVQGRIYPQGNDGATDLYKIFRGFVQDELSALLGLESSTWVKRADSPSYYTSSIGVHYRDYISYDNCNVTYPKEKAELLGGNVYIGHERICPHCGEVVSDDIYSGRLTHDYNCDTNI